MIAKSASTPTNEAASTVLPATNDTTGRTSSTELPIGQPSEPTPNLTPKIGSAGYGTGKKESASDAQTSKPLVRPSNDLNKRWQSARSVREFAAQVNLVATAILNGEVSDADLEQARLYAGLARTVAQAMTAEIQRARFLREEPNLTFETREPI